MIFTEEEDLTYTSLEQRTAQGYLDVFPLFIPEESASVSIEEQKEFYDIMKKLYKLAYVEPQLFVPKLHEDDVPPMLFSGRSDSEQETLTNMKKFRKSVDTLIWQMYLMGIGSEYTLNTRQKKILAGLGIADFTKLSPVWEWMAKKEHLERFEQPSRFAHCCFREEYLYAADIFEKAFDNTAFGKLKGWMTAHGYKPFQICNTTASDCKLSLTYANPSWSEETPRGGFEYKIKHTGISMRYEPCCKEPWILGVCIPGGMKLFLEHFDEMPEHVQDFVMSRIKRCDGCRYCVQTDKTGKRPFARIAVQYAEKEYKLCPYYPGYSFWWTSIDDTLADNIIGLLGFMDKFIGNKK